MFDADMNAELAEALCHIFLEIETLKVIILKNNIASEKEFEAIKEKLSSIGERKEVISELNDYKNSRAKEE